MNTLPGRFTAICLVIYTVIFLTGPVHAQKSRYSGLEAAIRHITDTTGVHTGIAVCGLNFDAVIKHGCDRHYPMQSTYKFPLAIAVLHDVDKGRLSLMQKVHIPESQLDMHTWSPMVKDFPHGDIDISLEKLLIYAVSKSDNNACDVLFRLAGGTRIVQQYVHSLGVKEINIAATEAEMKKAWKVQYTNWCNPAAMTQLLKLFYSHKLLSPATNTLLMKWMTESENSPNRLKGLLPAGTVAAHKTGTSDTNDAGITAATNDVGIITLPDGRCYAISVYVSDYKGGVVRGEHIIAEISKVVWDYFIQHKN
ncbi:class A beta-lactamase, subclass A2 [Chitinophagaceae bacterium MMS25-I14]